VTDEDADRRYLLKRSLGFNYTRFTSASPFEGNSDSITGFYRHFLPQLAGVFAKLHVNMGIDLQDGAHGAFAML
jgi:hypothetical protein